jgi:hypothetical protein
VPPAPKSFSRDDGKDLQFAQFSEIEQRELRRASVIGERFPAWAVAAAAADADADDVESTCERLAERRLFIRTAGIGELADGTLRQAGPGIWTC